MPSKPSNWTPIDSHLDSVLSVLSLRVSEGSISTDDTAAAFSEATADIFYRMGLSKDQHVRHHLTVPQQSRSLHLILQAPMNISNNPGRFLNAVMRLHNKARDQSRIKQNKSSIKQEKAFWKFL